MWIYDYLKIKNLVKKKKASFWQISSSLTTSKTQVLILWDVDKVLHAQQTLSGELLCSRLTNIVLLFYLHCPKLLNNTWNIKRTPPFEHLFIQTSFSVLWFMHIFHIASRMRFCVFHTCIFYHIYMKCFFKNSSSNLLSLASYKM